MNTIQTCTLHKRKTYKHYPFGGPTKKHKYIQKDSKRKQEDNEKTGKEDNEKTGKQDNEKTGKENKIMKRQEKKTRQ